MQTRTVRKCLWAIVLLALAVRIVYAFLAPQLDPFLKANPLHGDAAAYDGIARNLLLGYGFASTPGHHTAFWPPLYPFFLAGLYRLLGYHPLWARLAQAVLGTIAVGATAGAAHIVFGRRVALLTALGMALYPHLVYFGAWLIAEALYMALLGLTLWVAAYLQRRAHSVGFVALGALLELGALAKPAALMLVPLVVLWVWIAPPRRTWRNRLGQCLLVVLAAIAVILPWTVRNYRVFHAWVPISTNGGYTFYGANNPDAFGGHREGFPPALPGFTEPQAEREYYRLGIKWIVHYPGDFVRLTWHKLARLLSPLSVASYEHDYPLPLTALVRGMYMAFLGTGWSLAAAATLAGGSHFPCSHHPRSHGGNPFLWRCPLYFAHGSYIGTLCQRCSCQDV
nr:glycosyltransferase family 39 protein [Chloroflexota bacterium]